MLMRNNHQWLKIIQGLGLREILPETLLTKNYRVIPLNARETLFHRDEPIDFVYLVLSGSFSLQGKVVTSEEPVIYAFKRPGSFMGIFAYLDHSGCHNASAISLESSTVLEIPAALFFEAMENHTPLRKEVHRQLAANFRELQKDRELQRAPVAVRLASFLLQTLRAQEHPECRSILMKLTKKNLSKKIGSEPETVIRLLADWTRRGIIKNEDKMIEICDLPAMERLSHYKFISK